MLKIISPTYSTVCITEQERRLTSKYSMRSRNSIVSHDMCHPRPLNLCSRSKEDGFPDKLSKRASQTAMTHSCAKAYPNRIPSNSMPSNPIPSNSIPSDPIPSDLHEDDRSTAVHSNNGALKDSIARLQLLHLLPCLFELDSTDRHFDLRARRRKPRIAPRVINRWHHILAITKCSSAQPYSYHGLQ